MILRRYDSSPQSRLTNFGYEVVEAGINLAGFLFGMSNVHHYTPNTQARAVKALPYILPSVSTKPRLDERADGVSAVTHSGISKWRKDGGGW
jgi:hypothetical protein